MNDQYRNKFYDLNNMEFDDYSNLVHNCWFYVDMEHTSAEEFFNRTIQQRDEE